VPTCPWRAGPDSLGTAVGQGHRLLRGPIPVVSRRTCLVWRLCASESRFWPQNLPNRASLWGQVGTPKGAIILCGSPHSVPTLPKGQTGAGVSSSVQREGRRALQSHVLWTTAGMPPAHWRAGSPRDVLPSLPPTHRKAACAPVRHGAAHGSIRRRRVPAHRCAVTHPIGARPLSTSHHRHNGGFDVAPREAHRCRRATRLSSSLVSQTTNRT